MKERFDSIISYLAEHKQSVLMGTLAILGCIVGFSIIVVLLPFAIPIGIAALILYKVFTGFPSIFGSVVQVCALTLILLGVCGLMYQNVSSEEDKNAAIGFAATIFEFTHAPSSLVAPLTTEIGAWSAIGIGLTAGLVGEMVCGITAAAMAAIRIGDKIKRN